MTKILNILNAVCEGWIKEYKFDAARKFRFDYGNLKQKIAVEIEGGVWTGGGHVRGKGYIKDMQKYNLAQLRGWIVLRYTYGQEDVIEEDIKKLIEKRIKSIDIKSIEIKSIDKKRIEIEKNDEKQKIEKQVKKG